MRYLKAEVAASRALRAARIPIPDQIGNVSVWLDDLAMLNLRQMPFQKRMNLRRRLAYLPRHTYDVSSSKCSV